MNINYQSDFKIVEGAKNGVSLMSSPFRFTYYVTRDVNPHIAEYDGNEFHGCSPTEDGRVVVAFDQPSMGIGEVMVKREYFISDADFKDGVCDLVSVERTGIYLGRYKTDDITEVENLIGYYKGERGEQGPQGPQGPAGPQGPRGEQGEKGETGAQGPQGPEGPQGPQGPQGAQGAQGAQGVPGEKGDKGDKGDAGATVASQVSFTPTSTISATNVQSAIEELSEAIAGIIPDFDLGGAESDGETIDFGNA